MEWDDQKLAQTVTAEELGESIRERWAELAKIQSQRWSESQE
jgi:hypothetical protein